MSGVKSSVLTVYGLEIHGGRSFTGLENCVTNNIIIIIKRIWSERKEDLEAVKCLH